VRIAAAFGDAGRKPAVLIGMDTPQVTHDQLAQFDPSAYDACLGPTADGGYWCLGLRDPSLAAAVVPGVPMSTPTTFLMQRDRLTRLGLRVQLLDHLVDVDTVADARIVADLAPATGFATAWTRLTEAAA
jgi:glycosyltransferase A (GT-A) superfamily protein (DUF2064 family)